MKMRKRRTKKRKNILNKNRTQQLKDEQAQILSYRKKAPYIKKILHSRGLQFTFLDFLDSYEAEFSKLIDEYLASRPTLIGIYETDDEGFKSTDWARFGGAADWQQVFYNCDDDLQETYGREAKRTNAQGCLVTLRDSNGCIHTMVRIYRDVKCAFQHKEFKYALKIPVLLHEIGHVIDVEERINFDPEKETCRILDAEVFANHYTLEQCVQRGYRQSFKLWLDLWREYVDVKDYRSKVARRTLDKAPLETDIIDWTPLFLQKPTEDELKMIGERGIRALRGD